MSNQEILEKAIQKAIEGGWEFFGIAQKGKDTGSWEISTADFHDDIIICLHWWTKEDELVDINRIIFNHDFAKALWGEEHECDAGYHKQREIMHIRAFKLSNGVEIPARDEEINLDYVSYCLHGNKNWKWHLQRMVIANDPIAYLGEHL